MESNNDQNSKLQLKRLTTWMMEDCGSQEALYRASGLPQSTISGYLNQSDRTRDPNKKTRNIIVNFLSTQITPSKRSSLWTLATFEQYLASSDSPNVFLSKLSKAGVPEKKLSLVDRVEALSDEEKFEALELIVTSLKKNHILAA